MQESLNTPNAKLRLGLFAIVFVAILGQTIFTLFRPSPEERQKNNNVAIAYPESVPLENWQLVNSAAVPPPEIFKHIVNPGWVYNYQGNDSSVRAQVHLQVDGPGAVNHYMELLEVEPMPETFEFKFDPERGSYGVVKNSDRTYLSSCVNAVGKSTFTEEETTKNRFQHGISPASFFGWLMGFNHLTDNRCLFTLISMPISIPTEANHQVNIQMLEATWKDWYDWWKPELQKSDFR